MVIKQNKKGEPALPRRITSFGRDAGKKREKKSTLMFWPEEKYKGETKRTMWSCVAVAARQGKKKKHITCTMPRRRGKQKKGFSESLTETVAMPWRKEKRRIINI